MRKIISVFLLNYINPRWCWSFIITGYYGKFTNFLAIFIGLSNLPDLIN